MSKVEVAFEGKPLPEPEFGALIPQTVVLPADPGWRLAVLGPDEDLEACPIVAWATVWTSSRGGEKLTLEPLARVHGQDGSNVVELNAGREDRIVGILAPGDELFDFGDAGRELAVALREQEERLERAPAASALEPPEAIRVEVEQETRKRTARAELRQAVWEASQHLELTEIRELIAGVVLEIESDAP